MNLLEKLLIKVNTIVVQQCVYAVIFEENTKIGRVKLSITRGMNGLLTN